MNRVLFGIVFLSVFSFSLWGSEDWQSPVKEVSGAVVNVVVEENVDQESSADMVSMGSGVIFKKDSDNYYLATVNANIEGLEHKSFFAVASDAKKYPLELVGKQESVNIAVYKFTTSDDLEAKLKSSSSVDLGKNICILGSSLNQSGGLQLSASSGIVAKTGVTLQGDNSNLQIFEVDALVTLSGLGGIVIDNSGKMVGFAIDVTSRGDDGYMQQGLILSSASFLAVTDKILSLPATTVAEPKEELAPLAPVVNTTFYGLVLRDATPEDLKENGSPYKGGIIVENIMPGSAGEKAGFRVGDLIVGADSYGAPNFETLQKIEQRVKSRGVMVVFVYKNGKRENIYLDLKEPAIPQLPGLEPPVDPEPKSDFGVSVGALSDAQKEKMDFGVVVSSVESESAFAKAGIRAGDVIQEVQDVLIQDEAQFKQEMSKAKAGDKLLFYVMHGDGSSGYVTVSF